MLLGDLRIAPALRPVELEHQLSVAGAKLVDAVLVAVEANRRPSGARPKAAAASSTTSGVSPENGCGSLPRVLFIIAAP